MPPCQQPGTPPQSGFPGPRTLTRDLGQGDARQHGGADVAQRGGGARIAGAPLLHEGVDHVGAELDPDTQANHQVDQGDWGWGGWGRVVRSRGEEQG